MTYRFGAFEFDDATRVLQRNGRTVALEPQPSRALAALLARAGEMVPRDELKEAVWGTETHVDFDRGLAYCLSQIRAALGDAGDNPRFVQTIPKRGYRFIAPVVSMGSPGTAGASGASGATRATGSVPLRWGMALTLVVILAGVVGIVVRQIQAPRPVVVAVSIFDNETGDAQLDRLVNGMADLVVVHLTKMDPSRLVVVGNAAVLRQPRNIRNLKAVAGGVKADYVLLGQLQRGDTGYRFITHLIRLSDETHLKANRLEMVDGDVSHLETDVIAEFERAVREHVLPHAAS